MRNILDKHEYSIFQKKSLNGIVHYHDGDKLIFSEGKTIYLHTERSIKKKLFSVDKNLIESILLKSNLYRRLTRSHIYHVIPVNDEHLLVFVSKQILYLNISEQKIVNSTRIKGSNPLQIENFGNTVYYGDYIRSSQNPPIHLYKSEPPYSNWSSVKTFNGIRHIHGVFRDPYTNLLWVTTGDENEESWIFSLSRDTYEVNFSLGGSQTYRAVTLLFTEDYIYYGTDTPREQNYIYRFKRGEKKVEKLSEVGGSIFFGTKANNHLFFSTAAEPSKINKSNTVELWHSSDGINWNLDLEFKKDVWHSKLFRYGLIFFPNGPGDGKNLWFSTMGTVNDQKIYKGEL